MGGSIFFKSSVFMPRVLSSSRGGGGMLFLLPQVLCSLKGGGFLHCHRCYLLQFGGEGMLSYLC